MTTPACIAIDWGSSSFRLWVLAADGAALVERRSDAGMTALQPAEYEPLLASLLAELGIAGDTPTVICGMAGAAQGWRNAPYLDLPARLLDVPLSAASPPMVASDRDVRILPGLAQRVAAAPDVIRGEETALLGAHLAHGVDGLFCLPGTHSKWVSLKGSVVETFRTAMTGETFALFAERSTLAHFAGAAVSDDNVSAMLAHPAFADAVCEAREAPADLLAKLFSVRAGPLLFGEAAAGGARARLSGLLIGAEIAAMTTRRPDPSTVTLLASGALAEVYASAFDIAGVDYALFDAEASVRAGLCHAGRLLWPSRFGARA